MANTMVQPPPPPHPHPQAHQLASKQQRQLLQDRRDQQRITTMHPSSQQPQPQPPVPPPATAYAQQPHPPPPMYAPPPPQPPVPHPHHHHPHPAYYPPPPHPPPTTWKAPPAVPQPQQPTSTQQPLPSQHPYYPMPPPIMYYPPPPPPPHHHHHPAYMQHPPPPYGGPIHPAASHPPPPTAAGGAPSYAKPQPPPNEDTQINLVAETNLPSPPSSPERKVSSTTLKKEDENKEEVDDEHLGIVEEQLVVIGTENNIEEELGMMSSKPIEEPASNRTNNNKETIAQVSSSSETAAGVVVVSSLKTTTTEKLETIAPVATGIGKTPSAATSTTVGPDSRKAASAAISDMSPIAMCFDRMLVAAEYIKTPNAQPLAKSKKTQNRNVLPLSQTEVNTTTAAAGIKRFSSGSRPNPFDELAADPELERLVVLQMAMQRQHQQQQQQQHQLLGTAMPSQGEPDHGEDDSEHPKELAPASSVISEGFYWREYPACETVLYKHMEKYYEISAIQKNYKVQQHFNNVLVQEVRDAATSNGWTIDPDFDDKKLRDRIRCFYKTHLQNAKKRLATMQKHADSYENQCIVAVFIRCVRNPELSFQESLAMDPPIPIPDAQENVKRPRMEKLEKLKRLSNSDTTTNTTNL